MCLSAKHSGDNIELDTCMLSSLGRRVAANSLAAPSVYEYVVVCAVCGVLCTSAPSVKDVFVGRLQGVRTPHRLATHNSAGHLSIIGQSLLCVAAKLQCFVTELRL